MRAHDRRALHQMPIHSLRSAAWRRPRLALAAKSAGAAGAAWLLVQPFGGFVDDYPYYAPLGAVVVMSTSVVGSVRSAAQAVAAIATGAALAFAVDMLPLPGAVAIAIGIGVGVLVGAAPAFGAMQGWVPLATLFVLIIGGNDPWRYAAAYAGLTAVGAALGIAVNLAFPQLPLTPAQLAQDRLREQLADQLDLLADGLENEQVLSDEDWNELRLALRPQARRVEDLVNAAAEARRVNWRAPRWTEAADRREERARALQRLTGCVDEIIALVGDTRSPVHAGDRHAASLRPCTVTALRAVAAMLRTVDGTTGPADATEASATAAAQADRAVTDLAHEAARVTSADGRYLPAAAVAVTLHQAVEAWT